MKTMLTCLLCGGLVAAEAVAQPATFSNDNLKADIADGILTLSDNGGAVVHSPAEGHWSIATEWKDNHPQAWSHGKIASVEKTLDGFVLRGDVTLPNGAICECRDSCEWRDGVLFITRRWHYKGDAPLPHVTLSARWQQPGAFGGILLPGILYYGNPSGAASGAVPVLPKAVGNKGFYEEHRYPAPFASSEQSNQTMAALHALPSPVPNPERPDLWWSLGVEYLADATELACYTGFVSSNGTDGVVKAGQRKWLEMPNACMTLQPDMTVEKSFAIQVASNFKKGSGFCPAMDYAINFWQPSRVPYIDGQRLVRRKYAYALTRYHREEGVAGSLFHPVGFPAPVEIVYGWCGRSETFGYVAPILGPQCGDEQWEKRAEESIDFMCKSPYDENGFCVRYDVPTKKWSGKDFVSQGQALETFTSTLLDRKEHNLPVKQEWLEFCKKNTDVFVNRILKEDWKPVNTCEATLGAPIANAYMIFKDERMKQAVLKLADYYIARHITMDEPYWGGTLDARCEDKEGAVCAMYAFYAAWLITKDRKYLEATEHATQVFLTYVQLWDIPMPPSRLADNHFISRAWTAVSVQNMHLDVFGIFVLPHLWKIGRDLNRPDWQKLVVPMFVNCGQMMDAYGSQGEQIQHTNYAQRPPFEPIEALRGGYAENWMVFWMTAAFLNTSAQFTRLGIDYK